MGRKKINKIKFTEIFDNDMLLSEYSESKALNYFVRKGNNSIEMSLEKFNIQQKSKSIKYFLNNNSFEGKIEDFMINITNKKISSIKSNLNRKQSLNIVDTRPLFINKREREIFALEKQKEKKTLK